MPQPCSICTHVARDTIEQALADGVSYRHIAQHCGVSKSALVRHTQHRTPPAGTETGHVADQATPRPALAPEAAAALRRDIETLRATMAQFPRPRQDGYYLGCTLDLLRKLIDTLSTSAPPP
jgi:AcrR family transcriptional regulator